jgi:ABC-2 type transport system ATP-binding protein
MMDVINTENLTKHYGEVQAAEDITLNVKQGEIYGFLGLNGAGKTTTIRMLLGMIRPSRGTAWLFGRKVDPGDLDLWNRVGHLVELPCSYPELTVLEDLQIFYRLRLLNDPALLTDIMEQLTLSPYKDTKVRNLSLGNVQRLGIAKAMIHRPGLLILDEPANGLDPAGIVQIREILTDLAVNHGVTIFISSHILEEISRFATRIGIIHQGYLIRESEVDSLDRSRHRALHIHTLDNEKAIEIIRQKDLSPVMLKDGSIEITGEQAITHPEKVTSLLAGQGLPPCRVVVEEEDLEHYFLRIIRTNSRQS